MFLCPLVGRGQVVGTITGLVTDSSGAVVPNATVVVTNTGTGLTQTLHTNSDGIYAAEALPVGNYMVTVEATGFQKEVQQNIILKVADRLGVNFTLKLGQVMQKIEVSGNAPLVETESGEQSAALSTQQLDDLPVLGRNLEDLQVVIPGSNKAPGVGDEIGTNENKGYSVNGFDQTYQGSLLDGAFNEDMGSKGYNEIQLYPDNIGEIKVLEANYSAKYGQGAGSILLAVSKSGTQKFHGTAYEYVRNDALEANDFFANMSGLAKPPLRYNFPGYNIGGPLYIPGVYNTDKTKTFFFWSNLWVKQNWTTPQYAATPTEAMRNGDFSGYGPLQNPTDPVTEQPVVDSSGAPCVGGTGMTQINPKCMNSNVGLLFAQFFPMPNNPGFLNYVFPAKTTRNFSDETIRIDQNMSGNFRAFVRYTNEDWVMYNPTSWGDDAFPTIPSIMWYPSRNFIAKVTTVITPRLLNEFAYEYMSAYGDPKKPGLAALGNFYEPAGYTAENVYNANIQHVIPNMLFSGGWGDVGVYDAGSWWSHHNMNEWFDDLSWLVGRHSLSMGGVYMFSQTPDQSQTDPSYNGEYNFDGHATGMPIADAVLGLPGSYGELQGFRQVMYNFHQFEAYFQDDFKASKRLTVNLGVRYFYIPHAYCDLVSAFLPSLYNPAQAPTVTPDDTIVPDTGNLLNGIGIAGKNGVPRGIVENHKDTISPRFGFAYDLFGDGKTAIRGGYGSGYYRIAGNDIYATQENPPFSSIATFFDPPFNDPAKGVAAPLTPLVVASFDQVYKVPLAQSWSLGVQRQFTPNLMVKVAYVGSRGTHLDTTEDINQPFPTMGYDFDPRIACTPTTPYPCTTRVAEDYVRPFQGWSSIYSYVPVGSSTYHSLQVALHKRVSHGLTATATYTYSHSIDILASTPGLGGNAQNAYDLRANRGTSYLDRTHVLVCNYVYDIPAFRNSRGLRRGVFGGWNTSAIVTMESGFPLTPGYTSPTQGLATRPDRVAGVSVAGPKTVEEWFNTQAFTAAPFGDFGNAGTGIIRGPGQNQWDVSLAKSFQIGESVKIGIRSDFFNAWNHVSLNSNNVSTTYGSGSFGEVTGDHTPRVIQLSMRLTF